MKFWLVVIIILIVLIMGVGVLYFVNLNKVKDIYDKGYNNCIDDSNAQRMLSITKNNINNSAVNGIKETYGEEIDSCISQDGCFSTCGSPCSYINPKGLSFIEILKYESKNCLTVCEPQCFYP